MFSDRKTSELLSTFLRHALALIGPSKSPAIYRICISQHGEIIRSYEFEAVAAPSF